MYRMNLIYNPDHQQILEYHQELLKKAEQERLERPAMSKSKRVQPLFRKLLQHISSAHHTHKVVPTTTR